VPVLAPDSNRVVFDSHRDESLFLLANDLATVEQCIGNTVTAIRLTGKRIDVYDARPGSYGARIEQLASGHLFQHRRTWERELAAV
jgi:hypothetical protein